MSRISACKGGRWQQAKLAGGVLLLLILTLTLGGCAGPVPAEPPTATIASPLDGSTFTEGTLITFQGSATDPEDGALPDASLVWTSNIAGPLGTGESFTRSDLATGAHTITLTATDSQTGTASASVAIIVQAQQDHVVTFPDPNLERVIRRHIDKLTGPILRSDLIALTRLDAREENISDLAGIEHLTNLTWLWLGRNQIRGITPLAGLVNLTWLSLGGNQIRDITLLAGLTNLRWLELAHNQIGDIAPLRGLVNLADLGLENNQIRYITPLAGLTNLTRLDLSINGIGDIAPLRGLVNLADLGLENNQIRYITPLAGLTNLTVLRLSQNRISDITPLAGLTNLSWLWLANNQISDLAPLVANTGLGAGDYVGLGGNPLDLTPGSQNMLDIEELRRRRVFVHL